MEYKLKYESKAEAVNHLHELGITDENGNHDERRLALVWLPPEILEDAELNEDGEITKDAVYSTNIRVDIKTKNETFDFGTHSTNKNNNHEFM